MQESHSPTSNRRTVLKTVGTLSLLSTVGVGTALGAKPERKGNNFGNGNGVGAFLNEPALYKPSPVWADGVVNATGQDTVEVVNGAMTNVTLPGFPPMLPVAFDPVAVEVSPGTEVVWTWQEYPEGFPPIPHNVVSLKQDGNGPLFENPDGVVYQPGLTYAVTFDEPGNYLYYCTPHGAPFEVPNFEGETVYNEFGMRGAVIVTDE
ncbi:plastocyanin/azurin family copper-binding protein [Halogeometricum sp. S1BR25-6]|uniref:Plastocyanin/azurin family copper-binding protein n=1 Tax=Halogeometricum salsisoli TaxID=2950536 RepID=A0ABU2GJW5_9EURY|nr:plastocyanin/azurin family copper-binding protein [Halogeometricum sp. S1BR25-6]MDS0301112.1 plastocyanin/azurin family copper-binding protein [Halogeometricum sp. S1BR25-6]